MRFVEFVQRFVEFDFNEKLEREIGLGDVPASIAAGKFVWLDIQSGDHSAVADTFRDILKLPPDVIRAATKPELDTTCEAFADCLHFCVVACRMKEHMLESVRVDVVIGEGFLVTYSHGFADFIGRLRRNYRADFLRHAKSPSFLIYEIWDHLIRTYEDVEKGFQAEVEAVQRMLVTHVDDGIFTAVSKLGSDLLYFRKHVAPTRGVLNELATRKSIFVSEATQPFLGAMVAHLERLLADVIVNRDIVRDSLDLYVSMVGHRTNQVMNRLTLITFLFLPLTFICGIYGMNIEGIELSWFAHWGPFAWISLVSIGLSVALMKRFKML